MKITQNIQIKKALEEGRRLTQLTAFNEFHCFRLASRIADLRKMGMKIAVTMRKENGKSFAEYSLARGIND